MTPSRIRVLCVDDHPVIREGIALIISTQPDMEVVGSAATGRDAVIQFRLYQPDITLMDLRLGEMSGIEAISAIRFEWPEARIIVLTMCQGDEDIYQALAAGAATYLLKDSPTYDLMRTVRQVHAGQNPLGADVKAMLDARESQSALTPREVQVIELLSQGKQNKEVASVLDISNQTVTVHLKNAFTKLGVSKRTSAMNVALRRGIIHIE